MRVRTSRILDILEAEEEQAARTAAERERVQSAEEQTRRTTDAEAERARKLAAREMQKRMGKALLKNFTEQREQEEKAKKAGERREEEARSTMPSPATIKPRKSVSFANVPDIDKEPTTKPKPSAAWGDVSVNAFRAGMPKVTLKSEMLSNQPMKMGVVERVPGQRQTPSNEERDSDDESNPDMPDGDEDDEDGETPPLDGDFDDSGASSKSDEDPEDDFDFTQASLQREVALEYFRLRETIGTDAQQAMTAHSHVGDHEWDKPVCIILSFFLRCTHILDRKCH